MTWLVRLIAAAVLGVALLVAAMTLLIFEAGDCWERRFRRWAK